jgi:hypothetical protein
MAENDNRNTENFVLGLIVAAIVYFFFLRNGAGGILNATRGGAGNGATSNGATKSCCGGCTDASQLPSNPGVSLGNESFNSGADAFGSSSVAAVPQKPRPGGAIFSGGS